MRVKRSSQQPKWYDQHNWALWLGLVALVLAYIVGSRGLDTGSWWEYCGTLAFLIIGFNRLIAAVRLRKPKQQ